MIQIRTIENQTVFDLAKQYYGTIEAVSEIIKNNDNLCNNDLYEYELNCPLKPGLEIMIDNESKLRDANTLRKINKNITLWQEHSER